MRCCGESNSGLNRIVQCRMHSVEPDQRISTVSSIQTTARKASSHSRRAYLWIWSVALPGRPRTRSSDASFPKVQELTICRTSAGTMTKLSPWPNACFHFCVGADPHLKAFTSLSIVRKLALDPISLLHRIVKHANHFSIRPADPFCPEVLPREYKNWRLRVSLSLKAFHG
nr:hypothetical protein CFP56_54430 [Quercus suber]